MTVGQSLDPWLSRKLAALGGVGDCRFPGCTAERERPRPGKPGPAPKFCPEHNNAADRQRAYRAEQAEKRRREAEAAEQHATAAQAAPLTTLLERRAREESVLAELLPRTLASLQAIEEGRQAAADTDAVAAHIAQVQREADERVAAADAARAAAEREIAAARTAMQWALLAATAALADRDSAYAEAAAALREAADADARAAADRAALEDLQARHGELRDVYRQEKGAREQLDAEHQQLTEQHRVLQERHGELTERAGRLDGELAASQRQLERMTERHTRLQGEWRTATGDLATARETITRLDAQVAGLTAQTEALTGRNTELENALRTAVSDLAAARTRVEQLGTQATDLAGQVRTREGQLSTEQAERRAEVSALTERLTTVVAEAAALRAQLAARTEPAETAPSDRPATGGTPVPAEPVDLGQHHGRTWSLDPDPDHPGGYLVRADGTAVGTVRPQLREGRLTGWWSASHGRRTLATGRRRFPYREPNAAALAVVDAEARHRPLPPLDDDAFTAIPPALRAQLHGAAVRIDPRRGRLARLEPAAYRRRLHAALGEARRTASGRIHGRHLAVLLDAARDDLGGPRSEPAQHLYDVLQQIRPLYARAESAGGAGS